MFIQKLGYNKLRSGALLNLRLNIINETMIHRFALKHLDTKIIITGGYSLINVNDNIDSARSVYSFIVL